MGPVAYRSLTLKKKGFTLYTTATFTNQSGMDQEQFRHVDLVMFTRKGDLEQFLETEYTSIHP